MRGFTVAFSFFLFFVIAQLIGIISVAIEIVAKHGCKPSLKRVFELIGDKVERVEWDLKPWFRFYLEHN